MRRGLLVGLSVWAACSAPPGELVERFDITAAGQTVGSVEVRASPAGPTESIRVHAEDGRQDLAVDSTLPGRAPGALLRWRQQLGDRERVFETRLQETGFGWSSRVGLGIRRKAGGELVDAVHASATLPVDYAWDQSPLAAETWLGQASPTLGETRAFSSFNLLEGRLEPAWISAREVVPLSLGGQQVPATRYFAWTPSWGSSLWADPQGRLLAMQAPMHGLWIRRDGLGEIPQPVVRLPEGLVEEEVSVETPAVRLVGTLTRPRDAVGPLPGLVLVHGSGAIDRNGDFMDVHNGVLRTLAWEMAARGTAVVRWDKRGVGASVYKGEAPPLTLGALADDARSWADYLAARPDVRPDALFIAGHSEGGYIGPLVAADDPRFKGVILLAGPAHRIDRILAEQLVLILQAHGADPEAIARLVKAQHISQRLLETGRDRDLPGAPGAERSAAWMRSHIAHDPEATLGRVLAPVLAIYCSGDLQVPPSEADALRQMMARQGRTGDRVVVLDGLDHLLMPVAGQPGMGPYSDPDRRMDPRILETLGTWMGEQLTR